MTESAKIKELEIALLTTLAIGFTEDTEKTILLTPIPLPSIVVKILSAVEEACSPEAVSNLLALLLESGVKRIVVEKSAEVEECLRKIYTGGPQR